MSKRGFRHRALYLLTLYDQAKERVDIEQRILHKTKDGIIGTVRKRTNADMIFLDSGKPFEFILGGRMFSIVPNEKEGHDLIENINVINLDTAEEEE